jgi:hypothetical protein
MRNAIRKGLNCGVGEDNGFLWEQLHLRERDMSEKARYDMVLRRQFDF